ncbi:unnamed protein product [Lactuca virosa]|uniref:Uncharacterized protein n=1 Tax=Lactuca virosa TaxID=75947 RepID=A0AAU9NDH6_9ASTR|nr:unnamed protein product [Lactuca virosa]
MSLRLLQLTIALYSAIDVLAEELDLVTKMNLAVKEERYSDAGRETITIINQNSNHDSDDFVLSGDYDHHATGTTDLSRIFSIITSTPYEPLD